ncbi:MAG: glycosyltransferase family 39 protein [Candidatus Hatepunaea meridiana]|nr:glycosyltransferase family 39 protein [Candidatus Hatepunaea meridiana]
MYRKNNNILHRLYGKGWLIFFIAVAIRLIYLAQYHGSPFYQMPVWDAADYHSIAVAFSQAKLSSTLPFRAPLYPLLLGLIYMIFGISDLMPRLVQIIIGAWSCVLVMRIGERIYNKESGMIAGIIAAFAGLMIYYDLELLPTTLLIFFNLLFILELLKVAKGEGSAVKVGIYFALGVLTRPVVLMFLPVVVVWLLLSNQLSLKWERQGLGDSAKNGNKSSECALQRVLAMPSILKTLRAEARTLNSYFQMNIKHILKFLITALIPLLISLLLHIAAGTGPVLVSAQGGINFYIGNHHEAEGTTAKFPGIGTGWGWEEMYRWAEAKSGRPLLDSEVDRIFWKAGLDEIRTHPGDWLKLMGRKALLFWNKIEIPSNRDLYYHGRSFSVIGILMNLGFPLLLPFALVGIVINWKRKEVLLITALMLIFYLTTIQFFVNARFRHPMTPLMIILAVGGVNGVVQLIKAREQHWLKKLTAVVIALLVGFILPRLGDCGWYINDDAYGLFTEGRTYEDLGRLEKAEIYYIKALEANQRAPFVNYYLAELVRGMGDLQRAADHYRQELIVQPTYAKAWNNLGVVWIELKEEDKALVSFESALALRPELEEAARNAARIWGVRGLKIAEKGDWANAIVHFQKALSYQPDDPVFITMYLEARFRYGDKMSVEKELEVLLSRHPEFPPAVQLWGEMHK